MFITNVIFMTTFVGIVKSASELPAWHNKPLGSHIEPEKVDELFLGKLLSPEEFYQNYVKPRKPIVFRNVVKEWPAFKLWTDEYLTEKYGDMELRLEGKKEKGSGIPKGDVCLGRDRMRTFVKEYRQGADKYVVSDLPTPMYHEVKLPGPVSCGFLQSFVEIDLWMNSDLGKKGKGGNSILHKDAFNTLNCVINGTKDWKLIELKYNDYVYQSWEGPMDAGYGGFSLMNPDKVDAKRFPNVGKIPRWQFTTINAGDCLYLPSQMWHQVKSYGEVNRAIAFLFSQFNKKSSRAFLNTTNCPDNPEPKLLSEVDVDLQYPGTGRMLMGHNELYTVHEQMKAELLNRKKGYVTKKKVYTMVYAGHEQGAKNKEIILEKAKEMYNYYLNLAGGVKENMNAEFLNKLTRDQIRPAYAWVFPDEPANTYNHEYSYFLPEELQRSIMRLYKKDGNQLKKASFIAMYEKQGGTLKFAEEFWTKLTGGNKDKDVLTIKEIKETISDALAKYEKHRREDPDGEEPDENATITTPQGHVSQPRKERGGYATEEDLAREDENAEQPDDIIEDEEVIEEEEGIVSPKEKDEL